MRTTSIETDIPAVQDSLIQLCYAPDKLEQWFAEEIVST
jgi:hypothetical protein